MKILKVSGKKYQASDDEVGGDEHEKKKQFSSNALVVAMKHSKKKFKEPTEKSVKQLAAQGKAKRHIMKEGQILIIDELDKIKVGDEVRFKHSDLGNQFGEVKHIDNEGNLTIDSDDHTNIIIHFMSVDKVKEAIDYVIYKENSIFIYEFFDNINVLAEGKTATIFGAELAIDRLIEKLTTSFVDETKTEKNVLNIAKKVAKETNSPRSQGYKSAYSGSYENPYPKNHPHHKDWQVGYLAARKELD